MRQEVGRYSIKQPAAKITHDDHKVYFFVNLNEREIQETNEYTGTVYTEYEYDINSFILPESQTLVDETEFLDNPERYLEYEVPEDPTLESQIKALREENDLLTQCILELSQVIYS